MVEYINYSPNNNTTITKSDKILLLTASPHVLLNVIKCHKILFYLLQKRDQLPYIFYHPNDNSYPCTLLTSLDISVL